MGIFKRVFYKTEAMLFKKLVTDSYTESAKGEYLKTVMCDIIPVNETLFDTLGGKVRESEYKMYFPCESEIKAGDYVSVLGEDYVILSHIARSLGSVAFLKRFSFDKSGI